LKEGLDLPPQASRFDGGASTPRLPPGGLTTQRYERESGAVEPERVLAHWVFAVRAPFATVTPQVNDRHCP
jgi:hypothetical protein